MEPLDPRSHRMQGRESKKKEKENITLDMLKAATVICLHWPFRVGLDMQHLTTSLTHVLSAHAHTETYVHSFISIQ